MGASAGSTAAWRSTRESVPTPEGKVRPSTDAVSVLGQVDIETVRPVTVPITWSHVPDRMYISCTCAMYLEKVATQHARPCVQGGPFLTAGWRVPRPKNIGSTSIYSTPKHVSAGRVSNMPYGRKIGWQRDDIPVLRDGFATEEWYSSKPLVTRR